MAPASRTNVATKAKTRRLAWRMNERRLVTASAYRQAGRGTMAASTLGAGGLAERGLEAGRGGTG